MPRSTYDKPARSRSLKVEIRVVDSRRSTSSNRLSEPKRRARMGRADGFAASFFGGGGRLSDLVATGSKAYAKDCSGWSVSCAGL